MRTYPKEYLYVSGKGTALDSAFAAAQPFGKIKLSKDALFFKSGFKWYAVPFARVRRLFRRMDMVYGKLCCGGSTYDIQMLVIIDNQGRELEIHIGDDMQKIAEQLYAEVQQMHPQLQYGKM